MEEEGLHILGARQPQQWIATPACYSAPLRFLLIRSVLIYPILFSSVLIRFVLIFSILFCSNLYLEYARLDVRTAWTALNGVRLLHLQRKQTDDALSFSILAVAYEGIESGAKASAYLVSMCRCWESSGICIAVSCR